MSWLYSQALVEEYLVENSLDGEQFAPSKSTPTADEYFVIDRTTEPSMRSRFGTMSQPLTVDRGEELLTSFLAGFRAKTFPRQVKGAASKVKDPDYGQRWLELSGNAVPRSCTSKTPQCFAVEDLMSYSKISWKWGMMQGGECLEHTMPEHLTNATVSGFWQTPVADDAVSRKQGKWNSRGEPKLSAQVLQYPTPRAQDSNTTTRASESTAKRVKSGKARLGEYVSNQAGHGQLNPDWVEWLMGWPIGHTALRPLATDRFRQWQQQHGEFLKPPTSEGSGQGYRAGVAAERARVLEEDK